MKLFPEDPVFEIGKVGFEGSDERGRKFDLLGRKPLGQKLTELVDRINQPLVIALDGGWGSGKSHFLKLWTGAHSLELGGKAEVIYFDAFEHDFLDDPLVSLVSRLVVQGEAKSWSEATLEKMKKAAFPLTRGLLRTGVALATAGISEVAGPVMDAFVGKIGDATEDQIDGFWQQETGRIAAMTQFKKALEALTVPEADGDGTRKIVFIVDELDRCRPDYALSLLEIIKHFFAVPNVHFVLGVNLEGLAQSVVARYGLGINGPKYLQKFINLTVRLPSYLGRGSGYDWNEYYDHLVNDMQLPTKRCESTKQKLELFAQGKAVNLRDVQRVLSRLALLASDIDNTHWGLLTIASTAVILQVLSPEHYQKLKLKTLSPDEIDQLFSLPVAVANGSNAAESMTYCWQRILLAEPTEECLEYTKNAFSDFSRRTSGFNLARFLAEDIDTFHLPKS